MYLPYLPLMDGHRNQVILPPLYSGHPDTVWLNLEPFCWLAGTSTHLAHFLEVELRKSMEPVGQLAQVEKLHLEPEQRQTDTQRERKKERKTQRKRHGVRRKEDICEKTLFLKMSQNKLQNGKIYKDFLELVEMN